LIDFLKRLKSAFNENYKSSPLEGDSLLTNFPFDWFSDPEDTKLVYDSLDWVIKQAHCEDSLGTDSIIKY
jgi:hypothetical protein